MTSWRTLLSVTFVTLTWAGYPLHSRGLTQNAAPQATTHAAAPAARVFASDAGMVLNFIKPDKTGDFEAIVAKLHQALQKSDKPERKQQAQGWKVFRSVELAGVNVLYVFVIDPAVKNADYAVSNLLAEAFPTEAQALYTQYSGAYATGQNVVNLTLVSALGLQEVGQ